MQVTSVIIDDGSSQLKATRELSGKILQKLIPSSVVDKIRSGGNGFAAHDGSWKIDGNDYTVDSSFADRIGTDQSDRYQFSDMNTVLIHEVLRQMDLGGKDVDLSVTLPVNMFFKDYIRNDELIAKKKAACLRAITNNANHAPANIKSIGVFPESVGAVWDWVYDEKGNEVNSANRILVVDIGGTTTDVTVIAGDDSIEHGETFQIGVEKIRKELATLMDARPTAPQMDEILKTRSCGEKLIEKACREAVRDIAQKLSTYQNPESYDVILYVGGGAALFGEVLGKEYGGNYLIPENPSMANARGIIKSMIHWK